MSGSTVAVDNPNNLLFLEEQADADDKELMIRVKAMRKSKHSFTDLNMISIAPATTKDQFFETNRVKVNANTIIGKQKSNNSLMIALKNMKKASLSKKNFEFSTSKAANLLQKNEKEIILDSERINKEALPAADLLLKESSKRNSISSTQTKGFFAENSSLLLSSQVNTKSPVKISKGSPRKTKLIDETLGVNDILFDKSKLLSIDLEEKPKIEKLHYINYEIKTGTKKVSDHKVNNTKSPVSIINKTLIQKSKYNPQIALNPEAKSKFVFDNDSAKVTKHRKNSHSSNYCVDQRKNETFKLKLG